MNNFSNLLNLSVFFLKTDGSQLLVKVLEVGHGYIKGYDDERMNITILEKDIYEYRVIGGR